MNLSMQELLLCNHIKENADIPGIDYAGYEDTVELNVIPSRLYEEGMLDFVQEESIGRFSPLGELFMRVMSSPDNWIVLKGKDISRTFYIKDEHYLYMDTNRDSVHIGLLPSIPLLVGAVADFMENSDSIDITGESSTEKLSAEIADGCMSITGDEIQLDSEIEMIHYITLWIIRGMKDMEADHE